LIEADNRGKYRVTEKEGGLLMVILVYIVLVLLIWFYWFERKTRNKTQNQPGANTAPPG
jgi:NADH:ubiquinone oxidoreductase subunit H